MRKLFFGRRVLTTALLLAALATPALGGIAFAQDGTVVPEIDTVQPVENDDDGFPWGLLGLLGLGGLAGLRRQEAPERVETIDASRHR